MTAYFPLIRSNITPPSFMPTLDGKQYNCTVTWNLGGQRYYLNVFALNGTRILTIAIVETDADLPIASATYDGQAQTVTLTLQGAHNLLIGSSVSRRVVNCSPDDYNGSYQMLVSGPTSLSYVPATVPATAAMAVGSVGAPINLVAGYFDSVLLFRDSRFEVD